MVLLPVLSRCVQVRGYSVVLEAVESAILKTIACDSCAVVALGAEGEDKRLVAYLVPSDVSNRQGRAVPSPNAM